MYCRCRKAAMQSYCFWRSLTTGYSFWLSLTNGASFNDSMQKEIHAHYVKNAVRFEAGDLDSIFLLAKQNKIAIYLGLIERPQDKGARSLYCSLVYINEDMLLKKILKQNTQQLIMQVL